MSQDSITWDDEWIDAFNEWMETTFDPDSPRYDTLDEQNGHA